MQINEVVLKLLKRKAEPKNVLKIAGRQPLRQARGADRSDRRCVTRDSCLDRRKRRRGFSQNERGGTRQEIVAARVAKRFQRCVEMLRYSLRQWSDAGASDDDEIV